MFDQIKTQLDSAQKKAKKAATDFSDAAREKGMAMIESWVEILPTVEKQGLEITSFGLTLGLSPSLEVELQGSVGACTTERLDEILSENDQNSTVKWIFQAIRTTVQMHARANASPIEPLIVKIRVRLSPEIQVFVGKPFVS